MGSCGPPSSLILTYRWKEPPWLRLPHPVVSLIPPAPLGPAVRARINALAYRPAALLEAELRGDPEAALAAQLVQGVVNAGVRLLHAAPLDEVEALTVTLAQTLVRSRATPPARG